MNILCFLLNLVLCTKFFPKRKILLLRISPRKSALSFMSLICHDLFLLRRYVWIAVYEKNAIDF
jgi:hypothetical protein